MEEDQTIEYDETESLSLFANALSSPLPTASSNGKILEEAGLIRTSCQSGKRGSIKRCSIRSERVSVEFFKSDALRLTALTKTSSENFRTDSRRLFR